MKIRCEYCQENLIKARISWLELSQTDGRYYYFLPEHHDSQGSFPFGSTCAGKIAADGKKSKKNLPLKPHTAAFESDVFAPASLLAGIRQIWQTEIRHEKLKALFLFLCLLLVFGAIILIVPLAVAEF